MAFSTRVLIFPFQSMEISFPLIEVWIKPHLPDQQNWFAIYLRRLRPIFSRGPVPLSGSEHDVEVRLR